MPELGKAANGEQTVEKEGEVGWQGQHVQRHGGEAKPGVSGELQRCQRPQQGGEGREQKVGGGLVTEAGPGPS